MGNLLILIGKWFPSDSGHDKEVKDTFRRLCLAGEKLIYLEGEGKRAQGLEIVVADGELTPEESAWPV